MIGICLRRRHIEGVQPRHFSSFHATPASFEEAQGRNTRIHPIRMCRKVESDRPRHVCFYLWLR